MRITPTRDQTEYLTSIGVSTATIAQPGLATAQPTEDTHLTARLSRGRAVRWWVIILVIITLVSLANLTHAEEIQTGEVSMINPVDQANSTGETTAENYPETDYNTVFLYDQLNPLQQYIEGIEDPLKTLPEPISVWADAQLMHARRADEVLGVMELDELRTRVNEVVIWFTVIIGLILVFFILGRLEVDNRMRQIEQSSITGFCEGEAGSDDPEFLSNEVESRDADGRPRRKVPVNIKPTRPRSQPLPTPLEKMKSIISTSCGFRHIHIKPTLPSGAWGIGLATIKGNVRSENQDYGLCFSMGDHSITIVADGVGGLPHGQRAAYLAVISAAVSVIRTLGTAPRWHTPHVRDVTTKAIMDAAYRLAVEGDKLNIGDMNGGLRTTLIVVIGNKRELGFAYIGDGGGCVVNTSGDVNHFLDPQKANEFTTNVIAASLGPTMQGKPVTGVLNRDDGDIVIVGTDGVFDRIDGAFPKEVLRGCIQYEGNLQKWAECVVEGLASFKDNIGYMCDDNLTLGIMGDGAPPKLDHGFWAPISKSVNATDVVSSPDEVDAREGES